MYGAVGKKVIYYNEAREIEKLIDSINKVADITGAIEYGNNNQKLNRRDSDYIKMNMDLTDKIISLSKVSHQKDINLVNRTYFKANGYSIKEYLDMFLESLNFYKLIDSSVSNTLIEFAEKILSVFKMGKKDTVKYTTYLADAYFDVGEDARAIEIIFLLIDMHPNYDEPYQTMINWYLYKKESIDNLEKIVRKAGEKRHRLVGGSFVFERLMERYNNKDEAKYNRYRKLYDEWKTRCVSLYYFRNIASAYMITTLNIYPLFLEWLLQ
jgi:hypothetical protein